MPEFTVPVYITSTNKKRNSTKIVQNGTEFQCSFKDDVSVIAPKIYVRVEPGTDTASWNYMHIPALKRYYFITTTIKVTATTVMCIGEVDVLATYRSEILATDAYVYYSQSKYNPWIKDDRLETENHSKLVGIIEEDFTGYFDIDGCFVLTISTDSANGTNNSLSTSMVLSRNDMSALGEVLFSEDVIQEAKNYFNKPIDNVISCVWLPIEPISFVSAYTAEFKIGNTVYGGPYPIVEDAVTSVITISLQELLPYFYKDEETQIVSYRDFRNCEPYTKYQMFLPGCGLIDLPMTQIIEDGESNDPEIKLNYTLSPMTGDVSYAITIKGQQINDNFIYADGNIGVNIPIASKSVNGSGIVSGAIGGMSGLITSLAGIFTANPVLGIGGATGAFAGIISGTVAANSYNNYHKGSLNSFANAWMNEKIFVFSKTIPTSDSPANLAKVIGRPLFKRVKLGTLSGVVVATGVMVSALGATSTELDMINDFVNKSRQYDYGGVIIE